MNFNEQPQARRDVDIREDSETATKERVGDQALSTRDLAGGAAPKSERVKNVAERDRDLPNGRDTQATEENSSTPLFETGEAESLRSRWTTIQTQFVDEPRRSVEQADELVASAMKRLAEIFANEREGLEHNWDRGDDVSTEDLRIALQRYRSFFDRLLSV
jgi:hypothetical protein